MNMNIILSKIEKHPLTNSYMLICPLTCLPPYFGTKKECLQVQQTFEMTLQKEFKKLGKKEKSNLINIAVKSYGYKKENFINL